MLMQEKKKIEIDEREIHIYNFEILDFIPPFIKFKIKCSKGNLY
ncbi:MAG: hypothetical protein CM15mP102_18730 [Flavobacteriales bacterium]|nr:MAG: hypothetical protein CM15mP102_18730 [Flavobacteriales bacterium]